MTKRAGAGVVVPGGGGVLLRSYLFAFLWQKEDSPPRLSCINGYRKDFPFSIVPDLLRAKLYSTRIFFAQESSCQCKKSKMCQKSVTVFCESRTAVC